jgi:hypothetical protein
MQFDRDLLRSFWQYKASAWVLIATNVLPLLGVVFLGWDAFAIVALYWAENVVIGAINVLKIATCSPDPAAINWSKLVTPDKESEIRKSIAEHGGHIDTAKLLHHSSKLFAIPFFAIHYGLFCLVHGMFVFVLFGRRTLGLDPFDEFFNIDKVFAVEHLWWAAAALGASHLYSFFVNYLHGGEYRRTVVPLLMIQPYARVVVLHLAILFGGFVAMALGSNMGVLVLLIAGKTVLDLMLHLRERVRNNNVRSTTEPGAETK